MTRCGVRSPCGGSAPKDQARARRARRTGTTQRPRRRQPHAQRRRAASQSCFRADGASSGTPYGTGPTRTGRATRCRIDMHSCNSGWTRGVEVAGRYQQNAAVPVSFAGLQATHSSAFGWALQKFALPRARYRASTASGVRAWIKRSWGKCGRISRVATSGFPSGQKQRQRGATNHCPPGRGTPWPQDGPRQPIITVFPPGGGHRAHVGPPPGCADRIAARGWLSRTSSRRRQGSCSPPTRGRGAPPRARTRHPDAAVTAPDPTRSQRLGQRCKVLQSRRGYSKARCQRVATP